MKALSIKFVALVGAALWAALPDESHANGGNIIDINIINGGGGLAGGIGQAGGCCCGNGQMGQHGPGGIHGKGGQHGPGGIHGKGGQHGPGGLHGKGGQHGPGRMQGIGGGLADVPQHGAANIGYFGGKGRGRRP